MRQVGDPIEKLIGKFLRSGFIIYSTRRMPEPTTIFPALLPTDNSEVNM